MTRPLPDYYFRIRENGAAVFRMHDDARNGRLDMQQIATVNLRQSDIKAHGGRELSDEDRAAIQTWIDDRKETLDWRRMDDVSRVIEGLNLTAQWAQSEASEAELEIVTDQLFLAMHDLRSVLVRKKANRGKSD